MSLITSLQGFWKLNESSGNAADSSGNNNTLTNVNTVTYSAGLIQNGANFASASSKYLAITNASQTGLGITGNISVNFWVKISTQISGGNTWMFVTKFNYSGSNNRSYQFYYQDDGGGALTLYGSISSDGIGGTGFSKVKTIGTNAWHMITYTYTPATGTMEFFYDGVSLGTAGGGPASIFNGTADFRLGANHAGLYYDGSKDEVAVYSRRLSSSEILTLFNNGLGLTYPLVPPGGAFLLTLV